MAFLFGLGSRLAGLPPLVGYLIAGFVLYGAGMQATVTLREFADIGVTLLLFSIGLKLRIGNLLMPQVWAVASLHMLAAVVLLVAFLLGLGFVGVPVLAGLDVQQTALIAFALSFSSTVFAVKVLEEKGEMDAVYGRIAIGILIIQDIAAVIFLAISTGKMPTLWALSLLLLIPLRPVLFKALDHSGHGELMVLFGLSLALGGAKVFEMVGVKGDLGALILGLSLAASPRSSELARHLLGFKDLFLVGFFLVIGLSGPLSLQAVGIALLLVIVVPLKMAFFFWLLARFRLRVRTSLLTSLSLANYSEFGLIVAVLAIANGWMSGDWLIIIAVALSISFIIAAPINTAAHKLYSRFRKPLQRFETANLLPSEQLINPGDVSVIIFGMGRVGSGAYDEIRQRLGDALLGVDFDKYTVDMHRNAGRNVVRGSVTDPDFWERFQIDHNAINLVMLAMPNQQENLYGVSQLRKLGYQGKLTAIAKYSDDIEALKQAGADSVFNLYAEAGAGFADNACVDLPLR
jgi:predicted Kef-type K+ transport protein